MHLKPNAGDKVRVHTNASHCNVETINRVETIASLYLLTTLPPVKLKIAMVDDEFDNRDSEPAAETSNSGAICAEDPSTTVSGPSAQVLRRCPLSTEALNELRRDLTRYVVLRRMLEQLKTALELSNCACDPRECIGARRRAEFEESLEKKKSSGL
ncbi:unnamed protein product [Cylicocyclus nassatus]|uniref:Uncharacterized protein n=1 Tax=Cylicocyclus nassatus TaxID=53992 RepID=A0AA36HH77_CYLNA|nr:unnamed protein product [Cylicocyclus nassatus]